VIIGGGRRARPDHYRDKIVYFRVCGFVPDKTSGPTFGTGKLA